MRSAIMKSMAAAGFLLGSLSASATQVPEFFHQPEMGKGRVQVEAGYSMSELEDTGVYSSEVNSVPINVWADWGLSHSVALRVGLNSQNFKDVTTTDLGVAVPTAEENGIDFVRVDLIGHHAFGMMNFHYGLEGQITIDKDKGGVSPLMDSDHFFTPYIGVSGHFGPVMAGLRADFRSFNTTGNDWYKADNYGVTVFGEFMIGDMGLVGLSVDWEVNPTSLVANNGDLTGKLYARLAVAENLEVVPSVDYSILLEDGDTLDTDLRINALLGVRYHF